MVTVKLVKVSSESDESAAEQKGYTINNFESFSINVRTPISPMPLPEETADNNILVKMEGNTTTLNLAWTLVDSTTALNFGNKSSSTTQIKTVAQQLTYLSQGLQGSSLNEKFKLQISYSEVGGEDLIFYGFVTDMSFSQTSSTPVTFIANMSFIQGHVITTLDDDVPSKPTSINLTTPSSGGGSGRLTTTWAVPSYAGGSNSITNYDLEFRNSTSGQIEYKKFSQTGTSFTTPTGSVTSNTKFQVKIRANSSNGDGMWSEYYPIEDPAATTPDGVLSTAT
jgi:hypothetical protein